jgi:hypothetical protein
MGQWTNHHRATPGAFLVLSALTRHPTVSAGFVGRSATLFGSSALRLFGSPAFPCSRLPPASPTPPGPLRAACAPWSATRHSPRRDRRAPPAITELSSPPPHDLFRGTAARPVRSRAAATGLFQLPVTLSSCGAHWIQDTVPGQIIGEVSRRHSTEGAQPAFQPDHVVLDPARGWQGGATLVRDLHPPRSDSDRASGAVPGGQDRTTTDHGGQGRHDLACMGTFRARERLQPSATFVTCHNHPGPGGREPVGQEPVSAWRPIELSLPLFGEQEPRLPDQDTARAGILIQGRCVRKVVLPGANGV